jgi:hypothetical protein
MIERLHNKDIREFVENNLPKFSVVIFSLDKAKNAAIA